MPSWSNVAMRSSGGTKLGLARSVVACTKSRIACFAGPSFHEASGVVCACAAVVPNSVGSAGSAASTPSMKRRPATAEVADDMVWPL